MEAAKFSAASKAVNCSCHRSRRARCFECSRSAFKCTLIVRNKRCRRAGPIYGAENEPEDQKGALPSISELKTFRSLTDIQKALTMEINLGRDMPILSDRTNNSLDEFDA